MAKKTKVVEKLAVPPTTKATTTPGQKPINRLEAIERTAAAVRERTSAANKPSRLDAIQADARRAIGTQKRNRLDEIEEQVIRSGQREADDAEDDEE